MMRDARLESVPIERSAHCPYIQPDEASSTQYFNVHLWCKVSAARCARVSYLTHDGIRDVGKDLDLYDRLKSSGHWSPFEHPAMAMPEDIRGRVRAGWSGNFFGWTQYRKTFEGENHAG